MIVGKEIKIVKLNKNQAEEIIEDELIILNEDDEQILVLNKTATIIWSMLTDSEVDFYELCENFRNLFKDKPENDEVRRDVEEKFWNDYCCKFNRSILWWNSSNWNKTWELKMRR